jgi:hypothetical protein
MRDRQKVRVPRDLEKVPGDMVQTAALVLHTSDKPWPEWLSEVSGRRREPTPGGPKKRFTKLFDLSPTAERKGPATWESASPAHQPEPACKSVHPVSTPGE